MSSSVPIDVRIASNGAATNGHDCFVQVGSGNILPPPDWFMRISHSLWGSDDNSPAKWLRSLTGFPERTCRSAANGHTEVSGPMLYVLLRGPAGRDVFEKLMAGSDAQWWRDMQFESRVGRAALSEAARK